jgi:hypothetical protein
MFLVVDLVVYYINGLAVKLVLMIDAKKSTNN